MSTGVDLSQFFGMFFDEADELLAEMEQLLLGLDPVSPDGDALDGIFRAAHSIKGGAATFGCFEALARTTHLLENQLDLIRHGDLALRQDMIDLFLETKDVLTEQVAAYRRSEDPDPTALERICEQLQRLALEDRAAAAADAVPGYAVAGRPPGSGTGADHADDAGHDDAGHDHTGHDGDTVHDDDAGRDGDAGRDDARGRGDAGDRDDGAVLPLRIRITHIQEKDIGPLTAEMALMGEVLHEQHEADTLSLWLRTTASAEDIEAVCCFVVNADQLSVTAQALPGGAHGAVAGGAPGLDGAAGRPVAGEPGYDGQAVPARAVGADTAGAPGGPAQGDAPVAGAPGVDQPAPSAPARDAGQPAPSAPASKTGRAASPGKAPDTGKPAARGKAHDAGTIRVGVEKVDQIINLVGELVITQAMLVQTAQALDPVQHDRLLNGIEQLERNARDLQEAIMSIRMMPMDYVFSRFPRVVRENATRLGKRVRLVTRGQATELDKSLIERIIDPLTHLVRNSLDHGLETPEARQAQGKDPEGTLTLSAQHSGGQIIIDVSDDGAGLNRARVLKKATALGYPVSDATPDEELWQLIFAPGFSTAEKVTDISGRGVGMDVVRRNIQGMGGHVQLSSVAGRGTTTRIVLPLTLAILDGMSVRVGAETFILPLGNVTESMQAADTQIHQVSGAARMLFVRGEYLPIVALHEVFGVADAETDPTRAIAVILQAEDTRFALLVDQLIGQHQVVVKNLESNYRKVPGISAATILGDGSVALIVDVFALRHASTLHAAA